MVGKYIRMYVCRWVDRYVGRWEGQETNSQFLTDAHNQPGKVKPNEHST